MIILLIVGIILIAWLQYPEIKDTEDEPIYKKIFERLKIPMIFVCMTFIISLLSSNKQIDTSQNVFMSVPEF
jgi:hypothetical protein